MSPFLTAKWWNLINITYAVPPELLLPHVPKGVELDVQDGKAFVSLVAFDFLDTRVKGLPIPFHVNFPEINLRYYLKYKGKRGVAFLREFVPRFCIAFVANRLYNEPYKKAQMASSSTPDGDLIRIEHDFSYKGKRHGISVTVKNVLHTPEENTLAHYFKEHDIGFGMTHGGKTLCYDVTHPKWRVYEWVDCTLDVDFGHLYGEQWAFLADARPHCSLVAEGSEIAVYPPYSLAELDAKLK